MSLQFFIGSLCVVLALLIFSMMALFQCCEWTEKKREHDDHENKTHD